MRDMRVNVKEGESGGGTGKRDRKDELEEGTGRRDRKEGGGGGRERKLGEKKIEQEQKR